MKKLITTAILACAAYAVPAAAAEVHGTVGMDGLLANINGDAAKFNEYRALGSGLTGNFLFDINTDKHYLELSGEKFGYNTDTNTRTKDQKFSLIGGEYGKFKYSAMFEEIPHNLQFDAKTIYDGVGSHKLVTGANSNAAAAAVLPFYKTDFDYALNRKNYGVGFEASMGTPFFFGARYERLEVDGVQPLGVYLSQRKELPSPVDYATDNIFLQTGYQSKSFTATIDGTLSFFSNDNQHMTHRYSNTSQIVYLPPENSYYKIGGSMTYRAPVWDTTVMARGSYSKSENSFDLFEGITKEFEGDISYTTAAVAISSAPTDKLDTRVFVNYLDKRNRASDFTYGNATTENFDYHKINTGFEAGYKLPAKTKVTTGYEYVKLDRTIRTDATHTTDNTVFVQLKNNYLDWLTAKVKYQYLDRHSRFADYDLYKASAAGDVILAYWRPVDTADKRQNTVKVGFDVEPLHGLEVGLEYTFKSNNYDKSVLGVQRDDRHELYIDAVYAAGIVKVNPFFDLETVEVDSNHRRYAGVNGNPNGINDTNNYNWTSKRKDFNYALGINADVDIIKDKLTASFGWRYEDADGSEDFQASVSPNSLTPVLARNVGVDDYHAHTVTVKLAYNVTKNLGVQVGYLFENLKYADDHYQNYKYVPSQGNYLTGAYQDPDYNANIGWVGVTYRF